MYYRRLDVKQAIMDFASAGGSGVRECAFYNIRARSVQRYIGENGSKRPVSLESPAGMEQALSLGASAFYCSYWRYEGQDSNRPIGRDFVWTIRAEKGGLEFAKLVTARVLEALAEVGVEPWVKYSGELGFDLIIPLEAIPYEAWMGNVELLDVLQRELTDSVMSYLARRSDFFVEAIKAKNGASHVPADWRQMQSMVEGLVAPEKPWVETQRFLVKNLGRTGICLLSELRVRRGLLLAPMSLHPETGLVSVPVDPKRVEAFSVFDASPADVRAFEWTQPSRVAEGLVRYARPWQATLAETSPASAW